MKVELTNIRMKVASKVVDSFLDLSKDDLSKYNNEFEYFIDDLASDSQHEYVYITNTILDSYTYYKFLVQLVSHIDIIIKTWQVLSDEEKEGYYYDCGILGFIEQYLNIDEINCLDYEPKVFDKLLDRLDR